MTKDEIRMVPMDPTLELWLLEKLLQEPPETPCGPLLLDAVRDVLSGKQSVLLLTSHPERMERDTFFADCIKAGDLELYPKTRKVCRNGSFITLTP